MSEAQHVSFTHLEEATISELQAAMTAGALTAERGCPGEPSKNHLHRSWVCMALGELRALRWEGCAPSSAIIV